MAVKESVTAQKQHQDGAGTSKGASPETHGENRRLAKTRKLRHISKGSSRFPMFLDEGGASEAVFTASRNSVIQAEEDIRPGTPEWQTALVSYLLANALKRLKVYAKAQFMLDGQSVPRFDAEKTKRMTSYLCYLFTNRVDDLEKGIGLDTKETDFLRAIFALVCKTHKVGSLKYQQASWYEPVTRYHLGRSNGILQVKGTSVPNPVREALKTRKAAEANTRREEHVGNLFKQTEIAKTLLPEKLHGVSREVALALIGNFVDAQANPERNMKRTAVAVELTKEQFAEAARQNHGAVHKGICEGRTALQAAFKALAQRNTPAPAATATTETSEPANPLPEPTSRPEPDALSA